MNKSLITPQTVELVSRLTGKKLSREDIEPPVVFLAALVTVLLGVIYADGTVSTEETQRMRTTLAELIPANNSLRELVMLMVKGVKENQFYKNWRELLALTACFAESEKLLLISFGYQMSAADGTIDNREKQYLKFIANRLGIDERYLTVLEASFSSQSIGDTAALAEVHLLLDPAQFQSLDSLFVRAASHMIGHLPAKPKPEINQKVLVSSYQELKKFQEYRQQLNVVCDRLNQILTDGHERAVITDDLTGKIKETSDKLQSQCFRVVVVGEFSKGKSTLLNALLGEEIQPVSINPCSGTVTILKYGERKRVIFRYKDGRKEDDILPEEYQEKASISEEEALGSPEKVEEVIANSEIAEIVFEHPDLELCRNGVEIIDSPGLNEQAKRTEITEQVLKTADAVIFLISAQNALTEKEKKLLLELKKELNYGQENEGARNIFIVVNFFDQVRQEQSRKQVRQRVENIVKNQNLIAGENRIHFISAQSTLDAILEGKENEYLKSFQDFTKSIERFLTEERGAIALTPAEGLKKIINISCDELNQKRKILEGNLTVSQQDKPKIFEQMAEVSGRDVKIRVLAEELMQESLEETVESWNEWVEGLGDRLLSKSNYWISEHGIIMGKDKLTKDYSNQFVRDITQEIENWGNQKVQGIVRQNMAVLEKQLTEDIYAIRQNFKNFDKQLSSNLVTQFNNLGNLGGIGIGGSGIANSISDIGDGGLMGGLGIGAVAAAALIALPLSIIPVILGTIAAAIAGGLGWKLLDSDEVKAKIKQEVCKLGFDKFDESVDSILEKVQERIITVFQERIKESNGVMREAILLWEKLLQDQEKRDRQSKEECDAEKLWIENKRQELLQVEKEIEGILIKSKHPIVGDRKLTE